MHLNCTEDEARYSASLAHGREKMLAEDWMAQNAEIDRLKAEVERLRALMVHDDEDGETD